MAMSVPPEVAWLVPLVLPFLLGFVVGAIIKRALKLLIAVAALVILLVVMGSLTFTDIYKRALELLPTITGKAQELINILPYTSGAFLVGLALGLFWK
jgi:uncharacterized membrane protein (Fun14 family)